MELTALNVSNELKEQIYKNMNEIHVSVDVFVECFVLQTDIIFGSKYALIESEYFVIDRFKSTEQTRLLLRGSKQK